MRPHLTIAIKALLLAALSLEHGCLFKKSPRKATIVIPPPPPPPPPAPLPTPPQLPAPEPKPASRQVQMPRLPPPTAPRKSTPRRKKSTVASTEPKPTEPKTIDSKPAVPKPALIPNPTPSLQPILSPRETEERTQRIRTYLEQARLALLRAERAKPDSRQRQLINQIRTFLQQADDARHTDLVRAENLAERAAVLSRGLSR
ncbi:MAG: hypothetical protein ACK6DZ_15330 [Acidobacteriota bacterium]